MPGRTANGHGDSLGGDSLGGGPSGEGSPGIGDPPERPTASLTNGLTVDTLTDGRHPPFLYPLLLTLLAGAAILSLATGPVPLGPGTVLAALAGHGDHVSRTIVLSLRLPRTGLALMVGGTLGLAGAVLQGYLRNPLAEPSVIGISNTSALGAVIALYFGFAALHPAALPLAAIAFSILALLFLFLLAGRRESPLTLILAGIALAAFSGAAISLALNLAPNPFAAMDIMTWLLGSLENRAATDVLVATPCILIGIALLLFDGRALDALSLGEEGARSLGVDLARVRRRVLLGVAVGVGGAVAVSGAIGFVGLIVPHMLRPFTDRTPSALLVPSLLGGAVLLTLADVLVRIIPAQNELRLGVLTAFLGVPIFLAYLLRDKRLW